MNRPKPVVLCVLDGWGYRADKDNNAIEMYEVQMNQSENQTNADRMVELTKAYEDTQQKLDAYYEKWEELSDE